MERLDAEHGDDLPVWNGEFHLEYHRGTLTSQARTKQNNRKSEFMLHDAEFLAAYAALVSDFEYPHGTLQQAWELTCLNHFRDILPGSSVTSVYDDADRDYARIRELAGSVRDDAIAAIAGTVSADARVIAINPTSFGSDRMGILADAEITLADAMTQPVADGTLVALPDLTPYSIRSLAAGEPATEETGLSIRRVGDDIIMQNRLIRLAINSDGELGSVFDLEAEREVLAPGCTGNQLLAFEDRPMMFDACDIDIYFEDRIEVIREVQSIKIVETGPLRAAVEISRQYRNSIISQRIYLTYNSKRIDCYSEIDWHESHIFLKAAFPVDILSPAATYEIQWGNVERPTHRNTSWDWAKFETAAQKWGDLSEGNYGVALLNDSKYGYACKHNELRLSLLKSATMPDPLADQGWHDMTYSLLPHIGDWRGDVIEQAYDLNDPLIMTRVYPGGDGSVKLDSLVSVDAPNVIIETVKQAEDGKGIIVRLYECHRARGRFNLSTGFDLAEAFECNLLEENQRRLDVVGDNIELDVRPYQIVSLRLVPA